MQPIVFNKAGKFMLTKFEGGKPDSLNPDNCFFRNGVVQQITPNISINGTPIPDGNSLWDAANLDTGIEGTIAVQLGYMPSELYAFIMGDTSEDLDTAQFPVVDKEITVPDGVKVDAGGNPEGVNIELDLGQEPTDGKIMIVGVDNTAFTLFVPPEDESTQLPEVFDNTDEDHDIPEGEYYIDGEILYFSVDDAKKQLFISYYYEAENVHNFGLPKTPVRPAYQLVIVGEAVGEDDTLYEVATTVDKCKVLGNINPPQQGGTPTPVTITFTVLKPRGTNRAVDYKAVALE